MNFFLRLDEWLKSFPKTSPPKNTSPPTPVNAKPNKENHTSIEKVNSQDIASMEKSKRMILGCYCAAIACAVLYVPRHYEGYNQNGMRVNVDLGYKFILSSSDFGSINFEVIFLEIVAITAIAAIAYIFRDKLFKL